MKTTEYTKSDADAVKILRDAYVQTMDGDILYDARQYLQDRARYERNRSAKETGMACIGNGLYFPTGKRRK